MIAVIEIPIGIRATIENFKWRSENKQWEKILNDHFDLFRAQLPGNDPSPNVHVAQIAAREFGGKVIMESSPEIEDLIVY